jgi:hypothetical protein
MVRLMMHLTTNPPGWPAVSEADAAGLLLVSTAGGWAASRLLIRINILFAPDRGLESGGLDSRCGLALKRLLTGQHVFERLEQPIARSFSRRP